MNQMAKNPTWAVTTSTLLAINSVKAGSFSSSVRQLGHPEEIAVVVARMVAIPRRETVLKSGVIANASDISFRHWMTQFATGDAQAPGKTICV